MLKLLNKKIKTTIIRKINILIRIIHIEIEKEEY